MSAEAIARALRGKRSGAGWIACCPAHDDQHPSFSVADRDGKTLVHCHAGCPAERVIDALRRRGLWQGRNEVASKPRLQVHETPKYPQPDPHTRSRRAFDVWKNALSAVNTVVEIYLRSRGIYIPVPPTLRFLPNCRYETGVSFPCIVALVTSGLDNQPLGIHRTFLAPDGTAKAPVTPAKKMWGPCGGGAVRLAKANDHVMIGEGIETTLSAMMASDIPGWAALSVSGMRGLDLPPNIRTVTILADADTNGEAAAVECAERWSREGRKIRIARPPAGYDFNDLLQKTPIRYAGDQS